MQNRYVLLLVLRCTAIEYPHIYSSLLSILQRISALAFACAMVIQFAVVATANFCWAKSHVCFCLRDYVTPL